MGRNHLQEQQVPKDPTIYSPGHATRRDHRVLASVSRGYPRLKGSLITSYSPVRHFTRLATFTFDLHASSTPPTFVLSQDQTLHLEGASIQCRAPRSAPERDYPLLLPTRRAVPSLPDFQLASLRSPGARLGFRQADSGCAHTLAFEATRNVKDH